MIRRCSSKCWHEYSSQSLPGCIKTCCSMLRAAHPDQGIFVEVVEHVTKVEFDAFDAFS